MKNLWFIVAILSMFVVNVSATTGGSSSSSITIQTDKGEYLANEDIIVSFTGMTGVSDNWVAIYRAGAKINWENVLSWSWVSGLDGSVTLDGLPSNGKYQVVSFYENSFNPEAFSYFAVKKSVDVVGEVTLSLDRNAYKSNQPITVTFANMSGNEDDWVGIYPAGKESNWDNRIDSKWVSGQSGSVTFDPLPAGLYEVRAFFNGNYESKGVKSFAVSFEGDGNNGTSTMYEDADNGISSAWKTMSGPFVPEAINGAVKLTTNWETNTHNSAFYELPMDNDKETILEVDIGGVGAAGGHIGGIHAYAPAGYMAHFGMGVIVETTNGIRGMTWDSFLNHENVDAYINDYGDGNIELLYPSPIEQVRGFGYTDINLWEHFKVDLNAYLQQLEPGNQIIKVKTFYSSGGYLDNIKLSSK